MPYTLTTEADMPVSVSALRDHCRIIGDDFDTQLTRAWYASSYDMEMRSGLLLRPCTVSVTFRGGAAANGLVLPVGPADISSVAIVDSLAAPVTGWYVNPNTADPTIAVNDVTQFEHDQDYILTYSAGLLKIPNDLMVAALELAAHHFENRESTAPIQLQNVPSSVWSIVANYGRGKV
tara:strand:+ start:1234 stop:1767 length:534 start_codon:yes stop_codon:yes gene_type:complete